MPKNGEYVLSSVPVRALDSDTYDLIDGSGVWDADYHPWFKNVSVLTEPTQVEAWQLTWQAYDVDNDELLDEVYTMDHERFVKTALKIAADTDLDLDVRAKYLGGLTDPDNWGPEFDADDANYLLQVAAWGELRYS